MNTLCGFYAPDTHTLDGVDLTAILSGKTQGRGKPVLTTYGRGNHSLRNGQFRYIRYRNGAEEFYDEQNDPYEWNNLANNPRYLAAKSELGKWLPSIEAPDIAKPLPPLLHATWSDEAFTE